MEDFASQLTQELGGKNSQILALNSRIVAQDGRTAELEAEVARQKDNNARLRAQLEEASAMSQSSVTAITTAPGVESQSSEVLTKDQEQIGGAPSISCARNDAAVFGRASPTEDFGGVNWQVFNTWISSEPDQRAIGAKSLMHTEESRTRPDGRGWARSVDRDQAPTSKRMDVASVEDTQYHATATPARKRRRAADVSPSPSSRMSEDLHGLLVDESQRPPTRDQLESLESETTPTKKQRPTLVSSYTPQKQTRVREMQTPGRNGTRMPHPYTALRVSPFQRRMIAAPPSPSPPTRLPTKFRVPRSSVGIYGDGFDSTVATPFAFKLVVSYSDDIDNPSTNMGFYSSTSMEKAIPPFWALLSTLREKWQERAGDCWAWEFQKMSNAGRKSSEDRMPRRFCITSKLANLPTNWRPADKGFWACLDCVVAGRPCFTWVMEKYGADSEADGGGGEPLGVPSGEFWCLPVHQDDRNCQVEEEWDIRTWVNEGESICDAHDPFLQRAGDGDLLVGGESEMDVCHRVDEYDDSEGHSGGVDTSAPSPQSTAGVARGHRRASDATLIVVPKIPKKKQAMTASEPEKHRQQKAPQPYSFNPKQRDDAGETNTLRKPEAAGKYYSQSPFDGASHSQQRRLSHIGRIEETLAGEDRVPKCGRCEARGYVCRRYTAAAMDKFNTTSSNCARCVFGRAACQ